MAVVAVAAAAEAATPTTAAAALPPLPFTMPAADTPQPEIPPCLNDLMPCVSAYDNSSMMAPCCDAVAKVFKNDPACICQVFNEARNYTKQLGIDALDSEQQMFARCKISGTSASICNNGLAGHGTPAGESSAGSEAKNSSPHSRLTEVKFPIY
uniref:Bifunctional inhibitor/plant lipid transfer protein/seed storage helical domain-containing protein n=1 Tax=Leersia perrieri TaxID=77586 RepID=A0A0D9XID7_9ORYZ